MAWSASSPSLTVTARSAAKQYCLLVAPAATAYDHCAQSCQKPPATDVADIKCQSGLLPCNILHNRLADPVKPAMKSRQEQVGCRYARGNMTKLGSATFICLLRQICIWACQYTRFPPNQDPMDRWAHEFLRILGFVSAWIMPQNRTRTHKHKGHDPARLRTAGMPGLSVPGQYRH